MDDFTRSYSDSQIIQWLREGRLDAEMAVRLGLTVGETKEKIARLQARLGASDREDLSRRVAVVGSSGDDVDWSRPKPGEEPAVAPSESNGETAVHVEAPNGGGYSLRVVALAAIVGVAVAGGVIAAVAVATRGGGGEPASAAQIDDMETATVFDWTATPVEPTSTPTPHPGVRAVEQTDTEVWHFTRYASGDTVDGGHGIVFIDTRTGDAEGYLFASSGSNGWASYNAGRGNRLIFAGNGEHTWMYDRETDRSWRWAAETLSMTAASGQYVMVNETQRLFAEREASATTRFLLLDVDVITAPGARPAVVSEIDLPVEGRFRVLDAQMTADGRNAVVAVEPPFRNGTYDIYAVELRTGAAELVEQIDARNGTLRPLELAADEESFTVMRTLAPGQSSLFASGYTQASRYDWNGSTLARLEAHGVAGPERVEFSPDGQYAIAETVLATSNGELVIDRWPMITVYRKLSAVEWETVWRVRSATMVAGDQLEGPHWLADSSGFVANVRLPAAPNAWAQGQAGVFSVEDGTFEPLPTNERPGGGWWFQTDAVLPSPDASNLFSNHRVAVFNASTEAWHSLETVGPFHLNPWNGTSDEMMFAFPDGGHDGGWGAVLLAPLVEFAPLPPIDGASVVVDGDGECLRVRSKPGTTGEVLDCLADGTEVTLGQPEVLPYPPGNWPADFAPDGASVHFNLEDRIGFVYVASGAVEGWVAIDFLRWPE